MEDAKHMGLAQGEDGLHSLRHSSGWVLDNAQDSEGIQEGWLHRKAKDHRLLSSRHPSLLGKRPQVVLSC